MTFEEFKENMRKDCGTHELVSAMYFAKSKLREKTGRKDFTDREVLEAIREYCGEDYYRRWKMRLYI